MERPDNPQNCCELRKIRLKLGKWPNRCIDHNEPLVNPCFLVKIESFFHALRTELYRFTLPGFPEDCRLLPVENAHFGTFRCANPDEMKAGLDLDVAGFWMSVAGGQENNYVRDKLNEHSTRLVERWDEVLAEARRRLGRKFRESDYPSPATIKSHFTVDWEIEQGSILLSSHLPSSIPLTQHVSPNIFEAVALTTKLKEAEGNRAEQRRILDLPDAQP